MRKNIYFKIIDWQIMYCRKLIKLNILFARTCILILAQYRISENSNIKPIKIFLKYKKEYFL